MKVQFIEKNINVKGIGYNSEDGTDTRRELLENNLLYAGNYSETDNWVNQKNYSPTTCLKLVIQRQNLPLLFDLINSDLGNVYSEFGENQVFNLPGSVCDAFPVKSQDQLDKGSWRALKNFTVNADGGSSFANGEVDQFGANENNSMGSGRFGNATWKSDPSQISGNYGAQTGCLHYEHLKHWKSSLEQCRHWQKNRMTLAFYLVAMSGSIAPKVLLKKGYGMGCDCRSLGAIMYEMLVGHPLFCSDDPLTTCRKFVHWKNHLKFLMRQG